MLALICDNNNVRLSFFTPYSHYRYYLNIYFSGDLMCLVSICTALYDISLIQPS